MVARIWSRIRSIFSLQLLIVFESLSTSSICLRFNIPRSTMMMFMSTGMWFFPQMLLNCFQRISCFQRLNGELSECSSLGVGCTMPFIVLSLTLCYFGGP
ncbi:hypothetical protein SUGI_0047920 [Cryptomeria japonica]|nr:hypothetical protein SUGI_0047920 [Cryptomeria japonica]